MPSLEARRTRRLLNPTRCYVAGDFKTQNCNLHSQIATKKVWLKQFVQHENSQFNAVALINYTLLLKMDRGLSGNK